MAVKDAALSEAAVEQALPHFQNAPGCGRLDLLRSIDRSGRYILMVEWDNNEAHTIDFRQSAGFLAWQELVGPYFAGPPQVDHLETVLRSI